MIIEGLAKTISQKTVTYDFERLMSGASLLKCSEFGSNNFKYGLMLIENKNKDQEDNNRDTSSIATLEKPKVKNLPIQSHP